MITTSNLASEPLGDSTIGTTARPRCKTDLSRSRTHNEQTIVRPCGVMLGHAAFYNAEAVSNVLVCVRPLYAPCD